MNKLNESDVKLIDLLSDGKVLSGDYLGHSLGTSRAAVWKQIKKLESVGLTVKALQGKGYQLARNFTPLNLANIANNIDSDIRPLVHINPIDPIIESTNSLALEYDVFESGAYRAYLTEYQLSGKGRRGRTWLSPYGSGLTMSIAVDLERGMSGLDLISLFTATSIAEFLTKSGIENVKLKWPNDVYCDGKKLAGILLEAKGEGSGFARLVVGVGVNVSLPEEVLGQNNLRHTPVDLYTLDPSGCLLDRNVLAGGLISSIVKATQKILSNRFSGNDLIESWRRFDYLINKTISITTGSKIYNGRYSGVDAQGRLLLDIDGEVLAFNAGEVTTQADGR